VPSPAELRALASRVAGLAAEIDTARQRLAGAGEDAVRRTGFRLDTGVGWLRLVASELEVTADDLARVQAVLADPTSCQLPGGACPDHGSTLTSTGGRSRCRRCGRVWDYDRGGQPCAEPAVSLVRDPSGAVRMCAAHTRELRALLPEVTVTPLPAGAGPAQPPADGPPESGAWPTVRTRPTGDDQ
jgi:hypothetical protein